MAGEPKDTPDAHRSAPPSGGLASSGDLLRQQQALLAALEQELRGSLSAIGHCSEQLQAPSSSPEQIRSIAFAIERHAREAERLTRARLQQAISLVDHLAPPPELGRAGGPRCSEHPRAELATGEQRIGELEAELARARLAQQQLQGYADEFRRVHAESRRRLRRMTMLYEVSTAIASTVNPESVVKQTTLGLQRLLPRDTAAVYLLDEAGAIARRAMVSPQPGGVELPDAVAPGSGPVGRCLESGGMVLEGAGGCGLTETGSLPNAPWVLALPLGTGAQRLGVLLLARRTAAPFADEERHLAEMVAGQAAMALQNARLVTTDGLTGLYNRRYFEQTLAFECERARRVGRPLGLLMVDIDHFKTFNERYGHPAGDEVLRRTAGTLVEQLRRTDIVARVGGEEFAAILPENDRNAVAVAAERLRRAVEGQPPLYFDGGELPAIRISVGGASLSGARAAPKLLVQGADSALRRAKQQGRNRTAVADPEGEPSGG